VLIVEDQPDLAESLRMHLELLGHRVRVALDGASGIQAARVHAPDALLVDVGRPHVDGLEVARRVRAEPGLERVLLVALSGYSSDEDKRRAIAAGFDHHLVKPVRPDVLEALLTRLLGPIPVRARPRLRPAADSRDRAH
jgi:CheY-like chemotaxis protein